MSVGEIVHDAVERFKEWWAIEEEPELPKYDRRKLFEQDYATLEVGMWGPSEETFYADDDGHFVETCYDEAGNPAFSVESIVGVAGSTATLPAYPGSLESVTELEMVVRCEWCGRLFRPEKIEQALEHSQDHQHGHEEVIMDHSYAPEPVMEGSYE